LSANLVIPISHIQVWKQKYPAERIVIYSELPSAFKGCVNRNIKTTFVTDASKDNAEEFVIEHLRCQIHGDVFVEVKNFQDKSKSYTFKL
jgi:hypothetical protein